MLRAWSCSHSRNSAIGKLSRSAKDAYLLSPESSQVERVTGFGTAQNARSIASPDIIQHLMKYSPGQAITVTVMQWTPQRKFALASPSSRFALAVCRLSSNRGPILFSRVCSHIRIITPIAKFLLRCPQASLASRLNSRIQAGTSALPSI